MYSETTPHLTLLAQIDDLCDQIGALYGNVLQSHDSLLGPAPQNPANPSPSEPQGRIDIAADRIVAASERIAQIDQMINRIGGRL